MRNETNHNLEGEAEKEFFKKKILDFEAIHESRNQPIKSREHLKQLVEESLLQASEDLYDKNIITLSSSANKQDVEYLSYDGSIKSGDGAYIIIDFDRLSKQNQEIGKELGEVYFADGGNQLKITVPLTRESTFGQVQTKFLEIANKFVKQKFRPLPNTVLTLEEMRKVYAIDPNDETYGPDSFGSSRYWSEEDKKFYLSKEHREKIHEEVEEE